jgi:hypothetical protein
MKQLLKRLLNRIGLYTRGQTYAVLGQPFDQIQKTWKALSEAQRVQFAKHLYWHFRVNNEMISKLKRVDFDRLQFLLTHFSSSESRELLIALSDICFRSSNRTDTWPENLFAVLRRLVEISQMPAPRRDQILAQLSQVADIAQRWHAESSPWREEGLRLLASLSDMLDCLPKSFELWQKGWIRLLRTFIGLIKPNRASILAGFSKEPSSTLSPALSRALIDLQRNLPFQQALGRSRIRELYLVELFNGIEEVDIPLGAINELTGHANPADLL